MKEIITLTKEEARAILWEDTDTFEIVEDKLVDTTRWSEIHDLVVKRASDGKFFAASYSVGATECQDERPWDYEDEVKFTEVHPVEKTIIVYE